MRDWTPEPVGERLDPVTMPVRVIIAVGLAGVAVAFLVVGSQRPENSYGASVWANAGTTLLLFVPLVLVERLFERRVSKVEQRVDEAKKAADASIGELGGRLKNVQTSVDRLAEVQ